ncbi:MAG: cytochrome c1 [Pseudomonadota bacterium]
MKKHILSLLLAFGLTGSAVAASEGVAWDRFPVHKMTDMTALQDGARTFVNYCLNCHSAAFMRYNRMRDIGLTEDQIKKNLMFTTDKVGETMKVNQDPNQAKDWFGGNPPDLTLMTRSRSDGAKGTGADYLYTYLRSYYRDDTRPTGWNNLAYPNVGMPHVLWELQGQRAPKYEDVKDAHDPSKVTRQLVGYEQLTPGTMSAAEYDNTVANLVAYMAWMAEPGQAKRVRVGVWVLLFLGIFTIIAWRLNASYWKDIK